MQAELKLRFLRVPDDLAEQLAAADGEDEARRVMSVALHRAMADVVGPEIARMIDGDAVQ